MAEKHKKSWVYALVVAAAFAVVAWGEIFAPKVPAPEKMVAVSLVVYNHIENRSIRSFAVNGAGGPPVPPYHGGGSFTCCISIPEHWKPGLQARVYWNYGGDPEDAAPQSATVDIPEYTPENIGDVQVHFYPGHRVIVVSSDYLLGHPWSPLSKEDQAPWAVNEAVARNWEWHLEQQKKSGNKEKP